MSFRFLFGIVVGMILPLHVFGAGVVINEVLFDPAGTDSGHEWIELYNSDASAHDISNWELYPDGIGYAVFPAGSVIGGNAFFTVHLRSQGVNSGTDFYFNSASTTSNMGNTSGSAALFSGEPRGKDTIKSFVEWGKAGQTWEGDAEKAGLWTKGIFLDLISVVEGNSIGLSVDGSSAGGKDAWRIFATPTMGSANSSFGTTQVQSTESTTSDSIAKNVVWVDPPTIKAYAGEDRTVSVGALVQFDGRATGLKNEPLTGGVRLWWNFGDGMIFEGRHAVHVFPIPGVYLVGLHASDDIAAGSDYTKVTVLPNQISLTRVVEGENGFIQFTNPTTMDIDIGGWIFDDADGKQFIVPDETKIGAHADVAFSNAITGLLRGVIKYPVHVRYANSVIAITADHAMNNEQSAVTAPFLKAVPASTSTIAKKSFAAALTSIAPVTASSSEQSSSSWRAYIATHAALLGASVLSVLGAVAMFFIKFW